MKAELNLFVFVLTVAVMIVLAPLIALMTLGIPPDVSEMDEL